MASTPVPAPLREMIGQRVSHAEGMQGYLWIQLGFPVINIYNRFELIGFAGEPDAGKLQGRYLEHIAPRTANHQDFQFSGGVTLRVCLDEGAWFSDEAICVFLADGTPFLWYRRTDAVMQGFDDSGGEGAETCAVAAEPAPAGDSTAVDLSAYFGTDPDDSVN